MLERRSFGVAFGTALVAGVLSLLSCQRRMQPAAVVEAAASREPHGASRSRSIRLTEGTGIGFDDLVYAPRLRQVLVPAGATGCVHLIHVDSFVRTEVCGIGKTLGKYQGGHNDGVTSVDASERYLFAVNRSTKTLDVIDILTRRSVATTRLHGEPDYVRWIESVREVWVTEPGREQIEVFSVNDGSEPALSLLTTLAIPDGPESLVIDDARAAAYTHLWSGSTLRVDVKTHATTNSWSNGCRASRGIALDAHRGFLFVGCAEGTAFVLDVNADGRILGSGSGGVGVDIISLNLALNHVYLPSAVDGRVTVLGVGASGELHVLGSLAAVHGTHCVASDDRNRIWLCSPERGEVVVLDDTLPAVPP